MTDHTFQLFIVFVIGYLFCVVNVLLIDKQNKSKGKDE